MKINYSNVQKYTELQTEFHRCYKSGELDRADLLLEEMLILMPYNPELLVWQSCLIQRSCEQDKIYEKYDDDDLVQLLDVALKMAPNDLDAYLENGYSKYILENDAKQGLALAEGGLKIIQKYEKDLVALKIKCLLELKETIEAKKLFDIFIQKYSAEKELIEELEADMELYSKK